MSDIPATGPGLQVVLASRNAGKAREFARLLGPEIQVEALPAVVTLPEETGVTFAENAELKARAVFAELGGAAAVLADDSGLEVDGLGGRPGVRSARYAGETAGDRDNVALLLRELDEVEERGAQFVCELVMLIPSARDTSSRSGGEALMVRVRGVLRGVIEREPRGTRGFGYDPVFRPCGWHVTLAEASGVDKDRVSHRGSAARTLLARVRELGVLQQGEPRRAGE